MGKPTKTSITVGAIQIDFLVEAEDSAGAMTMFECTVPAGSKVPAPHSHDGFEETAYVLEGVCTWTLDGETREARPGDAICIRRGQVHGFDNQGDAGVRFLSFTTPGLLGPQYFRDMNEVLVAAAGGPPDLAAVSAVMHRHGLTPAAPVMAVR